MASFALAYLFKCNFIVKLKPEIMFYCFHLTPLTDPISEEVGISGFLKNELGKPSVKCCFCMN